MASIQSKPQLFKTLSYVPSRSVALQKPATLRCSAARLSRPRSYSITLLPGDGIGPEVLSVAKDVLSIAGAHEGIEFSYNEMPMGGAAIDSVGVPLPEETLAAARQSDAVLLGAIGGYKWDGNEKPLKPETGLLQLRAGLGVFANLRPASVYPQVFCDKYFSSLASTYYVESWSLKNLLWSLFDPNCSWTMKTSRNRPKEEEEAQERE